VELHHFFSIELAAFSLFLVYSLFAVRFHLLNEEKTGALTATGVPYC
jgi:hypothetical protein